MPGKGREDAKLGARATDLADSGCGRSVIWTACRVRRRARPIAEQPHRASGDGTAAFARAEQDPGPHRSEEHTSELQSLMRISYAVFCLKKKNKKKTNTNN